MTHHLAPVYQVTNRDKEVQKNMTKVYDISQLEKIADWRMLTRRPPEIKLEMTGLHKEDLVTWQGLINKQLSACGCSEGAILLMIAAFGYAVYFFLLQEGYNSIGWSTIGTWIGISLVGAISGKIFGLVRAQIQLSRHIRGLRASMIHSTGSGKI